MPQLDLCCLLWGPLLMDLGSSGSSVITGFLMKPNFSISTKQNERKGLKGVLGPQVSLTKHFD